VQLAAIPQSVDDAWSTGATAVGKAASRPPRALGAASLTSVHSRDGSSCRRDCQPRRLARAALAHDRRARPAGLANRTLALSLPRLIAQGTGICLTAMQGFDCNASTGAHNRCAGDGYSYCVRQRFSSHGAAGEVHSANGLLRVHALTTADLRPARERQLGRPARYVSRSDDLADAAHGSTYVSRSDDLADAAHLNSAWDLDPYGCSACQGQARGAITDGTCFGNGGRPPSRPGTGYVATVTVVVDRNGNPVQTLVVARPGATSRSRRVSTALVLALSATLALSLL